MRFAAFFKIYQILNLQFLKFDKILQILRHLQFFAEISQNLLFFQTDFFCENFEIAAVQKDANLVELEKCCQTHILLQNFVLIQPRTSPPKICKILQKKYQNLQNLQNLPILQTLTLTWAHNRGVRDAGELAPAQDELRGELLDVRLRRRHRGLRLQRPIGKISAKFSSL